MPWVNRPLPRYEIPAPKVIPYPTSAPPCHASELRISQGRGGAAAGTLYERLVFTNIGRRTCLLRGYPTINALGPTAAVARCIPTAKASPPSTSSPPTCRRAATASSASQPATSATTAPGLRWPTGNSASRSQTGKPSMPEPARPHHRGLRSLPQQLRATGALHAASAHPGNPRDRNRSRPPAGERPRRNDPPLHDHSLESDENDDHASAMPRLQRRHLRLRPRRPAIPRTQLRHHPRDRRSQTCPPRHATHSAEPPRHGHRQVQLEPEQPARALRRPHRPNHPPLIRPRPFVRGAITPGTMNDHRFIVVISRVFRLEPRYLHEAKRPRFQGLSQ